MITVKSEGLWSELGKLAKKSKTIKAAAAYVTDDSLIAFKKGDVLVVNASDRSIRSGGTSAAVLAKAFANGARLFSCDSLHGKTIVFDQHAYIGSANITTNSADKLDEIGVISDHPNVISGSIQFIQQLAKKSQKIDKAFIKRILEIEVVRPPTPTLLRKKVRIQKPVSWLISLRNDADFPGNEELVSHDNKKIQVAANEKRDWFFMRKCSFFDEAKEGDIVVMIDRDCQTDKSPQRAYKHIIIRKITPQIEAGVICYHYTYVEEHAITWREFRNLAGRAGLSRIGSGLHTSRKLTATQSNILFESWPQT